MGVNFFLSFCCLELESYSNVLGAFRAQGTLNAVKLRILKDLREAFHISDARHKAEVRRVVNDESLSTIAKMLVISIVIPLVAHNKPSNFTGFFSFTALFFLIFHNHFFLSRTYGPNTEIEWSKEGNRGFLILNRKPGQTALSAIANKVSELGDTLNRNLTSPAQTNRQRTLQIDNDVNASADKIVTSDPTNVNVHFSFVRMDYFVLFCCSMFGPSYFNKKNYFQVQSVAKSKSEKSNTVQTSNLVEARKKDSIKQQQQQHSSGNSISEPQQQLNSKMALTNNSTTNVAENGFTTTTNTATTVNEVKQSELLKVMEMPIPTPAPTHLTPTAAAPSAAAIAPRSVPKPNAITSNSRRRKSISALVANHSPAKAMMISNRRDTIQASTSPKIREHQPPEPLQHRTEPLLAFQHKKSSVANNVRSIAKHELPPANPTPVFTTKSTNSVHPPPALLPAPPQKKTHMPTTDDVQIIEAFVPHNVGTIKGTRNVMNAISQGAQLVKVIESKIIKHPVNLSSMYVTAPAKPTPAPTQVQQTQPQQQQQPIKSTASKQQTPKTYSSPGTDPAWFAKFVGSKIVRDKIEIISLPKLPPPSARNPNIVKTSDKIMHVSPHQLPPQKSNQMIRTAAGSLGDGGSNGGTITSTINSQNHSTIITTTTTPAVPTPTIPTVRIHKYQQKNQVVQVVQSQPRMVTIHPNSTIFNGKPSRAHPRHLPFRFNTKFMPIVTFNSNHFSSDAYDNSNNSSSGNTNNNK